MKAQRLCSPPVAIGFHLQVFSFLLMSFVKQETAFQQECLREAVYTALIRVLEEEETAFIGEAPDERGEER